jgi:hypothetical protein
VKGWRALVPAVTVGLPIVLALVFLFLFVDGSIGAATTVAACFALGAVVLTFVMMQDEEGEERDSEPWLRD